MFCNHCGAPNPDDANHCKRCGRAMAPTSPLSPPANVPTTGMSLPYGWGRFFGAFSAILCLLGLLWALLKLSMGQRVFSVLVLILSVLLSVQAWGLLKKRKVGLRVFYSLCVFMSVDLVLEYTYIPSIGETPALSAWFYAGLYLGSLPYFLKRRREFV